MWQIDGIPLSRPKRNISRDFSDAGREPSTIDEVVIGLDAEIK